MCTHGCHSGMKNTVSLSVVGLENISVLFNVALYLQTYHLFILFFKEHFSLVRNYQLSFISANISAALTAKFKLCIRAGLSQRASE